MTRAARKIGPLGALGKIQGLVGDAIGLIHNDRNNNGPAEAVAKLSEVFDLCVAVRSRATRPRHPERGGLKA
jgi:hypothetical protein